MARTGRTAGKSPADFVLDSSIAMAWSFEDETSPYADSVLDFLRKARALVPILWPLEVANALLMGERRQRSTEADSLRWIAILSSLPIRVDPDSGTRAWSDTMTLARLHGLTAYDAAYLELAVRQSLPLATLDTRLRTAAGTIGVTLLKPR